MATCSLCNVIASCKKTTRSTPFTRHIKTVLEHINGQYCRAAVYQQGHEQDTDGANANYHHGIAFCHPSAVQRTQATCKRFHENSPQHRHVVRNRENREGHESGGYAHIFSKTAGIHI